MSAPKTSTAKAAAELAKRDRVVAKLFKRHGVPKLRRVAPGDRFADLAESIVYQQLAGRAAAAIHGRFVELVEQATPEDVLRFEVDELMTCGLSRAKAASLHDLAEKVASGMIRLERIGRLDDQAVIDHLVLVRGIGRWTAEMFLMFTLGRIDVWPVDDYGVRAGYAYAWGLKELPKPKELEALGDRFRPYRSIAAWYCWRAVEDKKAEAGAKPAGRSARQAAEGKRLTGG